MKRDKQKQIPHLLAGIVFILCAFYLFEQKEILISVIAVGFGSMFLVVAGIHEWLTKTYKDASLVIIFFEALCMCYIAFMFFKKALPALFYTFSVLGLLYLILITYFLATRKKRYRHSSRRRSSAT